MKVLLNADWLEPTVQSKLAWIQEIRKHFDFTASQLKPLADFFWAKTENLTLSKEVIVDTIDFSILNNFGLETSLDDVWISYSKAIKHYHTEEEKQALLNKQNPFLQMESKLDIEILKLMDLIPEENKKEADAVLKRILEIQISFCHPFAS